MPPAKRHPHGDDPAVIEMRRLIAQGDADALQQMMERTTGEGDRSKDVVELVEEFRAIQATLLRGDLSAAEQDGLRRRSKMLARVEIPYKRNYGRDPLALDDGTVVSFSDEVTGRLDKRLHGVAIEWLRSRGHQPVRIKAARDAGRTEFSDFVRREAQRAVDAQTAVPLEFFNGGGLHLQHRIEFTPPHSPSLKAQD